MASSADKLVSKSLTKLTAERIGIFMQVFWAGGGCLLHFLNALIWRNDAFNRAPVFCDISEYQPPTKNG